MFMITGTWWDKNESSPESIIPRWGATQSEYSNGTQYSSMMVHTSV